MLLAGSDRRMWVGERSHQGVDLQGDASNKHPAYEIATRLG